MIILHPMIKLAAAILLGNAILAACVWSRTHAVPRVTESRFVWRVDPVTGYLGPQTSLPTDL